MSIELIAGFESTYQPAHDTDVTQTTRHDRLWKDDIGLLAASGVTTLRYPVLWHRVEATPGRFDWRHTDEVFEHLAHVDMSPIVDLVHHTSYPAWLTDGFADRRFSRAYLRYVEAFFSRYPGVSRYTLFNEPFSTLFLCAHEGIWPPYHNGTEAFAALCVNVLPAIGEASRIARSAAPHAEHVWVDACEHHTGRDASGSQYAAFANDRRFFVLDALLGMLDDGTDRPFAQQMLRHGGRKLFALPQAHVDVVGLDYYAHCQWSFGRSGGRVPTETPMPLAEQIGLYAGRYQRPCIVSETNIRGTPSDRATWLKYVLEQCEHAIDAGIDLRMLCWFPFIDSTDWDSLLFRCDGNIDPVGVYRLDAHFMRRPSSMSRSWGAAASGTPAAGLPAYTLQTPVRQWLQGYLPQMAHWDWQAPPHHERVLEERHYEMELRIRDVV